VWDTADPSPLRDISWGKGLAGSLLFALLETPNLHMTFCLRVVFVLVDKHTDILPQCSHKDKNKDLLLENIRLYQYKVVLVDLTYILEDKNKNKLPEC